MKALSVMPEWAMPILMGTKPIEYRTWKTSHRGDLLICASSKRKPGTIDRHALCVVTLDNITADFDIYEWHLSNVRYIKPFEVKGKLHLYDVSDSLITYMPNTTETLKTYYEPLVYRGRNNVLAPWENRPHKRSKQPQNMTRSKPMKYKTASLF